MNENKRFPDLDGSVEALSKDELLKIIQKGENSSVEFKSAEVNSESLAKEMTAFSNSNGGIIFLGVDDSGTISGLKDGKNYEEWAANVARNNVNPAVNFHYRHMGVDQKSIGIIRVEKCKDKPYQTLKHQYLVRVGSTNRITTQAELMRLFQQSGFFHFDAVGVDDSTVSHLDLAKIDNYFNRYDIDFVKESEEERNRLLVNSDILDRDEKATSGGLLIFGINPQRFLLNASISFAHFNGREITGELIDKQNIEGTIDYQVDRALAVIKNNLVRPSIIEGSRRVDTAFNYPDKVFRELLVNACVHRNYAIYGSRIRVFLFDDRIEFISPGALPNTVTIAKIRTGVSYAVNPVLVKFMENLRYIDKLGRGIPMVCREAEKNKKEVVFKELGDEFTVILYL
ncbi:MAG: transcriptional regulator [bacterium]|nr:transcriptional regulator [bacterium]